MQADIGAYLTLSSVPPLCGTGRKVDGSKTPCGNGLQSGVEEIEGFAEVQCLGYVDVFCLCNRNATEVDKPREALQLFQGIKNR